MMLALCRSGFVGATRGVKAFVFRPSLTTMAMRDVSKDVRARKKK
jgi:hypothetical protein